MMESAGMDKKLSLIYTAPVSPLDLTISGSSSWKNKIQSSYPCTCGHSKLIHATLQDQNNAYGIVWLTCLHFSDTDTGHTNRCQCKEYMLDNLRYLEELSEQKS